MAPRLTLAKQTVSSTRGENFEKWENASENCERLQNQDLPHRMLVPQRTVDSIQPSPASPTQCRLYTEVFINGPFIQQAVCLSHTLARSLRDGALLGVVSARPPILWSGPLPQPIHHPDVQKRPHPSQHLIY